MKKSKGFSWETLILIVYAGIMLFTVLHHEPWRDEAQAWLIARDLPLASIFHQMGYEGSPALWHMILLPFAKLGFPYLFINLVHLVIIYAAAAVFVYKAPFSIITKTLFLFSYYMAWEYSIIARNYSITILLLFLIAAFYGDRFRKPIRYGALVFLLFNTNVHSGFIAAALVAVFLFEIYKKGNLNLRLSAAVITMILGALLAFLQLLAPSDNVHYGFFPHINLLQPLFAIMNAFFPHLPIRARIRGASAGILLLMACLYLYKTSRAALFMLLFSFTGLIYIFMCKHSGTYRQHGFFLIFLVFALWISNYHKEKHVSDKVGYFVPFGRFVRYGFVLFLMNIFLATGIVPAAINHYKEYHFIFSGAKEMAGFIEFNNLGDNTIVGHQSPHVSALAPYLPGTKFWYADIENYGTFVSWNFEWSNNHNISFEDIKNRMNEHDFSGDSTLILLTRPIPDSEISDYRLLHEVQTDIFGYGNEIYFLYRQR